MEPGEVELRLPAVDVPDRAESLADEGSGIGGGGGRGSSNCGGG